MKSAIAPFGGTLTRVLYQFVKKGVIVMKCNRPVNDVLDELIEAGVEDVDYGEDGITRVISQIIMMTFRRLSTTKTYLHMRSVSKPWDTRSKPFIQSGTRYQKLRFNIPGIVKPEKHLLN